MRSAKFQIIDERDGSHIPFLRGILTRSLRRAGLPFDEAYQFSNEIRAYLPQKGYLSSADLRELVSKRLVEKGYGDVAALYSEGLKTEVVVHVQSRDGTIAPFSKGRLIQSMEICGLTAENAYIIAAGIEQRLIERKTTQTRSTDLEQMTIDALASGHGDQAALRFSNWIEFSRSGRPLVLLIGGTTGSGKSTISSELAHRLNIVRTQSTDMLREVMRLLIPQRLLPTLHASTFEAFQTMPSWEGAESMSVEPNMIGGYLSQAGKVGVGIEGVLKRAENEQVSLILEGIHVYPELQTSIASRSEALVVPIVLAVLKKKQLRRHLLGRGQQIASRRSERYLSNFDLIWELQSYLLAEADRLNIPIVINDDEDESVRLIMQTISEYVTESTSSSR
jgi:2-phosphoglycerate kinase